MANIWGLRLRYLGCISIAGLMIMLQVGCGATGPATSPSPPSGPAPASSHVALVVFENQKEDQILGNPNMPYLSGLAEQYGHAANYYADTHPSLGNYFMLTTGQIITNDESFDSVVTADNIVREVIKSGKTWKAYEETLPSTGFLGFGTVPYVRTHNPASYFSDVQNDPAQAANIVGLDQLQADLAAGTLPNLLFIEPNLINTMHDCPTSIPNCDNDQKLATGDAWAQKYLGALLSSPAFQQGGLLIIAWDESWASDSQNGGGHVLTIVAGTNVKKQYVSSTFYQHESVLRLMCDTLQVSCMGNGTSAPSMAEFFTGH